jgi:hypothetical protein
MAGDERPFERRRVRAARCAHSLHRGIPISRERSAAPRTRGASAPYKTHRHICSHASRLRGGVDGPQIGAAARHEDGELGAGAAAAAAVFGSSRDDDGTCTAAPAQWRAPGRQRRAGPSIRPASRGRGRGAPGRSGGGAHFLCWCVKWCRRRRQMGGALRRSPADALALSLTRPGEGEGPRPRTEPRAA